MLKKRTLIVELIKQIVNLKHNDLNEKIKPLIAHTNIQIKAFTKKNNKGLIAILSLMGKYEDILAKFEADYYEMKLKQTEEKEEEYKKKEEGDKKDQAKSEIHDNSMVIEEEEMNKLKELGIGEKKKLKISKVDQMKLALLKKSKANPKVLKSIEQIRKKYCEKNQSKQEEEKNLEEKIKNQKQNLRKQLEKRSMEHGVGAKNQSDIDVILMEDGQFEKDIEQKKKINIINIKKEFDFEPLIIEEEEDTDKALVDIIYRKYQKVLKYIFLKYCSAAPRVNKSDVFDKKLENKEYINIAGV